MLQLFRLKCLRVLRSKTTGHHCCYLDASQRLSSTVDAIVIKQPTDFSSIAAEYAENLQGNTLNIDFPDNLSLLDYAAIFTNVASSVAESGKSMSIPELTSGDRLVSLIFDEQSTENLVLLLEAVRVAQVPAATIVVVVESVCKQFISLNKNLKPHELVCLILGASYFHITDNQLLFYIRHQLDRIESFQNEDIIELVIALNSLSQNLYVDDLKRLSQSLTDHMLMIDDTAECISYLQRLQNCNVLSLSSLQAIREKHLDKTAILAPQVRLDLLAIFCSYRAFPIYAVQLLIFPPTARISRTYYTNHLTQILLACTRINYGDIESVERLLSQILLSSHSIKHLSSENNITIAYSVCYYKCQEYRSLLTMVIKHVFSQGRQLTEFNRISLLMLNEIIASSRYDFDSLDLAIPTHLKMAAAQEEKKDAMVIRKTALTEDLLKQVKGFGQAQLMVPLGPYYAQILDEKNKIVYEFDTPGDLLSKAIRHRHFGLMGFKTGCISGWQWAACKKQKEKGDLINSSIHLPVLELMRCSELKNI